MMCPTSKVFYRSLLLVLACQQLFCGNLRFGFSQTPSVASLDTQLQSDPTLKTLALYKHSQFVTGMGVLANRNQFLLIGRDITLWSPLHPQPTQVIQWPWIRDIYLVAIAVSPDEKWFVVADCLGKLYRGNVGDKQVSEIKNFGVVDIVDLAISPDSQQIAVLFQKLNKAEISLLSAGNNRVLRRFPIGKIWRVNQGEDILRGGNYLEYIDNDKILALDDQPSIWNVADGSLDKQLTEEKQLVAIGKSRSGQIHFATYNTLVQLDPIDYSRQAEIKIYADRDQLLAIHAGERKLVSLSANLLSVHDLATQRETQLTRVLMQEGNQFVGADWLTASNVLVVAEQHGLIRILGTEATRAQLELKPMHVVSEELDAKLLDPTQSPRPPDVRIIEQTLEKMAYESPADLLATETSLLRLMKADGWAYLLPRGGMHDPKEFTAFRQIERQLEFAKSGVIQKVNIGLSAAKPDIRLVEIKRIKTNLAMPFYPSTWVVEFDPSDQPEMALLTWEDSAKLKKFYEVELAKLGWLALPEQPGVIPGDSRRGFVNQMQTFYLRVQERSQGRMLVTVKSRRQSRHADRLLYEKGESSKVSREPFQKVVPYSQWLDQQELTPGYDSIDRYELEMKSTMQ